MRTKDRNQRELNRIAGPCIDLASDHPQHVDGLVADPFPMLLCNVCDPMPYPTGTVRERFVDKTIRAMIQEITAEQLKKHNATGLGKQRESGERLV